VIWPEADCDPRPDHEAGTGLIASVVGFAVVLVLLTLSVQLVAVFLIRTELSSAAFVGAETASVVSSSSAAEQAGDRAARALLGSLASRVSFSWRLSRQRAILTASCATPSLVPGWITEPLGLETVIGIGVANRTPLP
jgi:hypothetical protein